MPALILLRLVCLHLADLQVSLLLRASEEASGASSIAVEGTSADISAESSAATNDTLDTDWRPVPFQVHTRSDHTTSHQVEFPKPLPVFSPEPSIAVSPAPRFY